MPEDMNGLNVEGNDNPDTGPADITPDGAGSGTDQDTSKKYKVKVDGKEMEVTEDELVRGYQKVKASDKRFMEAAEAMKMAKSSKEVEERLKKGDLNVLREMGVPEEAITQFSENHLLDIVRFNDMSKAEQDAVIQKRRNDELEKRLQASEKANDESKKRASAQQAAIAIENDIMGAFKEMDLSMKGNATLVRKTAEVMYAALDAGNTRITGKQALSHALNQLNQGFSEHMIRNFKKDPKKFIDDLPQEIRDGIRKNDLDKVDSQYLPIGKIDAETREKQKPRTQDAEFRDYQRAFFSR